MQTKLPTEDVKIAHLTGMKNRELDERRVEALRGSLRQFGQIENITINGDGVVLAGHHRVEAATREGWETIRAVRRDDLTPMDEGLLQIHENTMRAELTFRQRMAHCDWLKANVANRVGRPKNGGSDSPENNSRNIAGILTNPEPADMETLVVEHGVFSSPRTYTMARAIQRHCHPLVIDELDSGTFTISRVYKDFVNVKRERQVSLLTRMKQKLRDAEEAGVRPGRAAAQKVHVTKDAAADYAFPAFEDKYAVLHAAPDWLEPGVVKRLKRIPVGQFISDTTLAFIDCPARELERALDILDHWKFHYAGVIAIDYAKPPFIPKLCSLEPYLVVFAHADAKYHVEPDGDRRMAAVHRAEDPRAYVVQMLTDYFDKDNNGYMGTRMLDLTATKPVPQWDALEVKFRRHKKS